MGLDSQKKQKYLLTILVLSIIAGAIMFWINKKSISNPILNSETVEEKNNYEIGVEKVDLNVLENEEFINLKEWGKISKETIKSESGRDNPFIPPVKK